MTETQSEMDAISQAEEIEALFVQSAGGMSYTNGLMVLEQPAPTTLFFSDRPDRVTGHIPNEEFVESWSQGKNSFASDPSNAVLSIFHPDEVSDIVVVLKRPMLDAGRMTYEVEILDGDMPAHGGASALFIDVIGRPLSPMSMAGMRRREMRRTGRRVGRR